MVAVQEAWAGSPFPHHRRVPLAVVPPSRTRPASAATYRRRRVVALAVLAAVLVAAVLVVQTLAGSAGGGPSTVPGESSPPVPSATVHVVQPGDTLWSIARVVQPRGDVRPLVDRLAARHGTALQAGERIRVG